MEEQDSIEEKEVICSNCESPLTDGAEFCHKCGQKNIDVRLTVKELFSQLFNNVFNVEGGFGAIKKTNLGTQKIVETSNCSL